MKKVFYRPLLFTANRPMTQAFLALCVAGASSLPAQNIDLAVLGTTHPGFRINGIDSFDQSGRSVSGAGDVNGDGLADLIVGAIYADPNGDSRAGESYVVFGKTNGTAVDLGNLSTGGFRIDGIDSEDFSGCSVSGAGDINGDGFADLIVGAERADPNGETYAGESYVVFGKTDGTAVDLGNLNSGGFRIDGVDFEDFSGFSVSGAGDVNGDGLADLIVGAFFGDPNGVSSTGESYVVFGKTNGAAVDLSNLSTGGFRIVGIDANDQSGRSVSGAGDVNGDGLADLIVGAQHADPNGDSNAGESYVVFGKTDGTEVDLGNLGTGGFRIDGIDSEDFSGCSVSGAGDVNGDGLADLIVGANGADPNGDSYAGESYVIFGKTDGTAVDLGNLNTGGFRIDGINTYNYSGRSVSGAGDVNGDGLADLIVGAFGADPNGDVEAGESYVVFGKNDGTAVDLGNLNTGGFRIVGIDSFDFSGRSVSGAGDVNGDGLADLIVGAERADPDGDLSAGESYVVFSPATPPNSATYRSISLGGNAPRQAIGITGDGSNDSTPDSRAFIDFADGTNVSTQTVTLTRNDSGISNLTNTANVVWEVTSDRSSWSSAGVTFKYTDSEISGLTEADLFLYKADSLSGPWTVVSGSSVDVARNQITGTVTGFSFFALSTTPPDTTPPTVSSVTRTNANPTNAATVDFTVTFSESVTGVDLADFSLTVTGSVSTASVTNVTGSGDTYTVTVNTGSGDGTVRLDVLDDNTIIDAATNALDGTFTTGQEYTIDKQVDTPVFSTVPSLTNQTSINTVQIDFFEDVAAPLASEFTTSGVTISNVQAINASSYTFDVTITGGDGAKSFQYPAGQTTDLAGNLNIDSAVVNIVLDATAPTVDFALAPVTGQQDPTNVLPIVFEVSFADTSLVTMSNASVSLSASTAPGTLVPNVTPVGLPTDNTFQISVTGATDSGDVTVTLVPAEITDAAGNDLVSGGASATVEYKVNLSENDWMILEK